MTTTVTLDVFSGRPNPTRQLTEQEEAQLNERLRSLTTMTDQRPSGSIGGLGYRGFTISRHDPPFIGPAPIHIHESIIDRGVGAPNLVDNTGIEQFLLEMFRADVQPEVHGHVSSRITTIHFLGAGEPLACPACVAADTPLYQPENWNWQPRQDWNNCYNYANNNATNTFAQPGRAHGIVLPKKYHCPEVQHAAEADGLVQVPNFSTTRPPNGGWYVALVVWPPGEDFHWYRQDGGLPGGAGVGCWSHKPGKKHCREL